MTDALVCGLGPSFFDTRAGWIKRRWVFGVNDCDRHVAPDHLIIRDGPEELGPEKRWWVMRTEAKTVWLSHPDWWKTYGLEHTDCRQLACKMRAPDAPDFIDLFRQMRRSDAWLCSGKLSPTAAVALAFHLGAERIGLLGIDLTDDHESAKVRQETCDWLASARLQMRKQGCDLANLSWRSTLAIPQKPPSWCRRA